MKKKYTNKKKTNKKSASEKYANEKKYTKEKKSMNGNYMRKVYELKIVWNEKQPLNVFLTKRNGKRTKPNNKVVLLDYKCT